MNIPPSLVFSVSCYLVGFFLSVTILILLPFFPVSPFSLLFVFFFPFSSISCLSMDKVPRFGSCAPPVNQSASTAGKERRLVSMRFLDTFFSILDWLMHFSPPVSVLYPLSSRLLLS